MTRHARQIALESVGPKGQTRLARARVVIIGAGGLGSPAIQYLAGAGVGHLVIVDPDEVEISNLHRQPIHAGKVGWNKACAAAAFVQALDPAIEVTPHATRLDPASVDGLIARADLVLDCADSFAVSYILSDACLAAGVALISASALRFGGYCGGFCGGAPSLRAVFPDLPERGEDCASAGVIGPVVGMLGACQAQMALAVLLGLTPSPLGQLVTLAQGFQWGGFRFDGAAEPDRPLRFIHPDQITPDDWVLELRDSVEAPIPVSPHARRADPDAPPSPPPGARVVLACRAGLRAWRVAGKIAPHHPNPIVLIATGDSP